MFLFFIPDQDQTLVCIEIPFSIQINERLEFFAFCKKVQVLINAATPEKFQTILVILLNVHIAHIRKYLYRANVRRMTGLLDFKNSCVSVRDEAG